MTRRSPTKPAGRKPRPLPQERFVAGRRWGLLIAALKQAEHGAAMACTERTLLPVGEGDELAGVRASLGYLLEFAVRAAEEERQR